ncbi:flagellar basal-body MS-ring/collar protein FliF [Nocardioides ferulae]|uniref:flagellar basal-body MS-ring/collar protein FliF n=1 Tax=Nocardioides ferulae TaxID=2340821 RepID=UPI000EB2A407|nr:flagellar basal-body MS-ring/collar protein FliF [Nocardioides ferulae]
MVQTVTGLLKRWQQRFGALAAGQKVTFVVGAAALLVTGFLVLRWATAPSYAPLFSNLSSKDASAVVNELEAQGVQYELSNGGATVMVPRDMLYDTRIALSGEGLPGGDDGGYALLDNQDLSTSEFQEQTDFKRAMEGELARTIEAIDGVETAVVHLAIPEKEVFADSQEPTTASVLIDSVPGSGFGSAQVQAVVHLVASSIDGLDPEKVTVANSEGQVLSSSDDSALAASTRQQQVAQFQNQVGDDIQAVLDRVVGPGNSTVQVTADLDFDKAVSETTRYEADPETPPLSSSVSSETYNGPGGGAGAVGGVVGADGQMDNFGAAGGEGQSEYRKRQVTEDAAVGSVVERRENAPGSVNSLNVGVVLDANTTAAIDPAQIEDLITAAVGIQPRRGDSIEVTSLPFDRSTDEASQAALEAAEAAAAKRAQMELIRNAAIAGLVLLGLLIFWLARRRKLKARKQATTYVVEQLRAESAERPQPDELEINPALAALEEAENSEERRIREELVGLVEKQPEEVASLLRGWLVEQR